MAVFEPQVSSAIKRPMSLNQFDAMVPIAFNIGGRAFANSMLVKKFNDGDAQGAAEEFPRWIYSGDRALSGLIKRRAAEHEMFQS